MQRHEREVFGIDAPDLMDFADTIWATRLSEQSIKDTNDSYRAGYDSTSWSRPSYMPPLEIR